MVLAGITGNRVGKPEFFVGWFCVGLSFVCLSTSGAVTKSSVQS